MSRAVIALAVFAAACGSDKVEVARVNLDRAADPAGAKPNVLDNRLHTAHLSGTTPIACSECHGNDASNMTNPPPERCAACHQRNRTALHKDAVTCTECHGFAADNAPIETECQRCHESAQGKNMAIKAHAKVDCRNCHEPHRDPSLGVRTCTECHEDHQQSHGPPNQPLIERCLQCHPPHTRSIEAVARCQGCHKDKLVRAVFRGHDKCETCHGADRQSAPAEPKTCKQCHGGRVTLAASRTADHARCESCHAPHDPRGTAVQSCRRCHAKITPKHPTDKRSGSCLGCHPAHPKAETVRVAACSNCHRAAGGDKAFHSPGRTTCTSCHGAHDFKPAGCSDCHGTQARQTRSAAGHQKCGGCHGKAHAPKASPASCGNCHASEYSTAPAGHRDCAKCHEPHGGTRLRDARCQSCHPKQTQATHGRIDGGCANCHRAHGPGGRAKAPACTSCHAPKKLPGLHAVGEHDKCTGCHRGHGLREMNRAACLTGCHAKQVDHEAVAKTCVGCHPFGASR